MPTPTNFEGINPRGTQELIPCKDAKAQNGVIANTKLIKDTVGWSGKNKLPKTSAVNNAHGVTFVVNEDGSVTANGTSDNTDQAVANAYFTSPVDCQLIVNGCNSGNSNIHIYVYCDADNARPYTDSTKTTRQTNNVYNGNDVSFFAEAGKTYRATCRIIKNTSVNNVTFYPMFRDADILDSTYEPYFGSTAFPRSEQAVLGAKNLFDNKMSNTSVNGLVFTVNSDKTVTVTGTATGHTSIRSDMTLPAGSYIGNGCPAGGSSTKYRMNFQEISGSVSHFDSGDGVLFTLNSETTIRVWIDVETGAGTNINLTFKPMIRLASDPDDTYVPYAMTNRELTEKALIFKGTIANNTDFNNIADDGQEGIYLCEGATGLTNIPSDFNGYGKFIFLKFGGQRTQVIISSNALYTRIYAGSAWRNWYKFTGTEMT